jgi:predicted aspartyl protease
MNIFKIQIFASNPEEEGMVTAPFEAVVNTALELTWLPGSALSEIGVAPEEKRMVYTTTKQMVKRETGYVILCANGHKTREEVVFAEPGDAIMVGLKALEDLGVTIDEREHGFIALTTLMAWQPREIMNAA